MPSHRQLKAAAKKLAERVVRKQDEVVRDARRLLPLSRGGLPPDRELIAPRQAEPLPQTRLPPLAIDSPGNIARAFQESAQFRTPRIQEEVIQMTPMDIIREVINEPSITITSEDLPIINDPSIMMDMSGQIVRTNDLSQFGAANLLRTKPKRKVSKYQKELGRQLKMLKKKHPRTKINQLMKRAHRATRKALSK